MSLAIQSTAETIYRKKTQMSETTVPQLSEQDAHAAIGEAFLVGCSTHPDNALEAVQASLITSFGPIVQKIIDLIKQGITSLPAILAALTAAGIVLPPWVNMIITVLLALVPH